jgi:hypothetical protein
MWPIYAASWSGLLASSGKRIPTIVLSSLSGMAYSGCLAAATPTLATGSSSEYHLVHIEVQRTTKSGIESLDDNNCSGAAMFRCGAHVGQDFLDVTLHTEAQVVAYSEFKRGCGSNISGYMSCLLSETCGDSDTHRPWTVFQLPLKCA